MKIREQFILAILIIFILLVNPSTAYLQVIEVVPNPNPPDLNKTDETHIAEWWQFPLWMNVHSFLLSVFPVAAPFAAFLLAGVLSCFGYRHINKRNLLEHECRDRKSVV